MASNGTRKRPASRKRKAWQKKARPSAWCKTFLHDLDGHTYVETSEATGAEVWVAALECLRCGTRRVDFMVPETCELISRRYFHPKEYDKHLARDEAKREVMSSMMAPEETTS
jgi:hypothetical protein